MVNTIRNYPFDLTRSICVIWIVGFWHMLQYLPEELQLSDATLPIFKSVTMGVLSCFTFLSGYFLKKYDFQDIQDALVFYKKRFLRFYPLFVIATFSLLICGSTIRQIVFATVGLSLLCPLPIQTLWYFSMLLLFYLMTPLLKIRRDDLRKNVISIGVVLIVLVLSYLFFDKRLVIYFPFYVLGLNVPNRIVDKMLNPFSLVAAIAAFVIIRILGQDNIILQIVQSLCGLIAIISFCKLVYSDGLKYTVSFVAEASMCAYLFHRPLYTIILIALRKFAQYQYMSIPIALLSLIVLFLVAYFIQTLYNRLIQQILLKYGK